MEEKVFGLATPKRVIMLSKSDIQKEVFTRSGIHITNEDPIWALYELMTDFQQDFVETYKQVDMEVLQNLKEASQKYSQEIIERSQKYADTVLEAANKVNLSELKTVLEAVNRKELVREADQTPAPKVTSEHTDESPNRMNQLFYANLCVLALNLIIFLAAAYLV